MILSDQKAMGSSLLRLQHVSRHYDRGKIVALKDITLEVRRGEWLTIIGPSGSGKTTLLNLMCGLDLPSQGHIFFQDHQPRSTTVGLGSGLLSWYNELKQNTAAGC